MMLAANQTPTYGNFHLAMLHRQLAMSEERTNYQQAESTSNMMNQITIFHTSPSDFSKEFQTLSWMDGCETPFDGKR